MGVPEKPVRKMTPEDVEDILRNARDHLNLWHRDYGRHGHPGFATPVPVPKTGA